MHLESSNAGAGASVLFLHGGDVAGWMWQEQVAALPDFHCLVPDLPAFGQSAGMDWTTLPDVADQLAAVIREHAHGGRAHVVGLSLGGVLAAVLIARHPDLIHTGFITGAPLRGVQGPVRWLGLAQISLYGFRWYWAALARAFQLPPDAREVFVTTGLGIRKDNARAMTHQVYDGVLPELDGLRKSGTSVLALVGEMESRVVIGALPEFRVRSEAVIERLVPGMHHIWNAEDPDLFNGVLRAWLADQDVDPRLLAT